MKKFALSVLVILALILVGCANLPFARETAVHQVPTKMPGELTPAQPGETKTAPGTPAPSTPPVEKTVLTLWIPPQFDPAADTPAGKLLKSRLEEFNQQDAEIDINVRIKAATGPAGLLESLTATKAAAPDALPDLIALPRQELEVAALKGLLIPFDGLTSLADDPDWYDYSRELMLLQGSAFGLPFAGDALILIYRPSQVSAPALDWGSMLSLPGPLAFPAGDPQALLTLALYQANGGVVEDLQGRPTLDAEKLARVLDLFAQGTANKFFPDWLSQYETDNQAWQAYKDLRAPQVITWISRYLSEFPEDTAIAPLPAGEQGTISLATGWVWAIPQPDPERQMRGAKLAEFLVESTFLADWSYAAGLLPTRPTSLAAWPDPALQPLLSQVVLQSRARPTNDLIVSIGPVLKDATILILKGQGDPIQVANEAADRLKSP